MTKKFVSMFLALVMCLSLSATAFSGEGVPSIDSNAASTDAYEESIVLVENEEGIYEIANPNFRTGIPVTAMEGGQVYEGNADNLFMRIDETRFMKAEELIVDLENYDEFKTVAESKGVSSQLLSDIDCIVTKVANGEFELEEPLTVYIPEPIEVDNVGRSVTSTVRTYTGYSGRRYYQELFNCKGNSLEFNVTMPNTTWGQYCNQVFQSLVITSVGAAADSVTGGSWSLLSVFLQSTSNSIETTQAFRHTAKLFENKYTKYTYLIQSGEYSDEYFLGSVIDYTYNYWYENFINVDGETFYSDGKTGKLTAKAAGYDNADEYAYRYHTTYPYQNRITAYNYKNTSENISTYVDSLFNE